MAHRRKSKTSFGPSMDHTGSYEMDLCFSPILKVGNTFSTFYISILSKHLVTHFWSLWNSIRAKKTLLDFRTPKWTL